MMPKIQACATAPSCGVYRLSKLGIPSPSYLLALTWAHATPDTIVFVVFNCIGGAIE